MNFIQFASAHGLVIDRLIEGRWVRVPTVDKPRGRNGAYKLMGGLGIVQNWAIMTEPSVWKCESGQSYQANQQAIKKAAQDTAKANEQAAARAAWILQQSKIATHPYLTAKGFPLECGHVWSKDGAELLVIPMRINGRVTGCQLIDEQGRKKFLTGSRTGGASFVFDGKGPHVVCEGYATALSARHALKNIKQGYTLHVCFSAANMARIASALPGGLVIADNDESGTGERVAKQIGWPYWMSDVVGEDANDYQARRGLFSLANGLKLAIQKGVAVT